MKKSVNLSVHENQNKLKQEVLEAITQIPESTDGSVIVNQEILYDLCLGFYKKGFDLGALETMKVINNDSRVNEIIRINLDLPI